MKSLPYLCFCLGLNRLKEQSMKLNLIVLQDVYQATTFKPACPQPTGNPKVRGSMSEDCLYLNVWTTFVPQGFEQGRRRPVVILIEGQQGHSGKLEQMDRIFLLSRIS